MSYEDDFYDKTLSDSVPQGSLVRTGNFNGVLTLEHGLSIQEVLDNLEQENEDLKKQNAKLVERCESAESNEEVVIDLCSAITDKNKKLTEVLEKTRTIANDFANNWTALKRGEISRDEMVNKLFIAFQLIHSTTIQVLQEVKK